MILRPYQQRVLDDLWDWFNRRPDGNPIVEAAVGAGKSLMIAALAKRADAEHPGTRVLVLVHQKELLEQNLEKILAIWPQADVGIYSASAKRKELGRQITYATIGSIYKLAFKLGRIDIVLADECHLINPRMAGMWRKFLADLSLTCPHARTIGWTGTPFRGNGVWLTASDDPLFRAIAAQVRMRELLDLGFLAPLLPAATVARIDTDDVRTAGDDYVVSELAAVTDRQDLVEATCSEIVSLAAARKRWLVFAVTIAHAEHVAEALRARGVAVGMVSADTPAQERAGTIAAFRAGTLRCLVNVAVLTTGFDVPQVDFIALLRATKSPVLYVQIAGRGMRLAPGKTDCLWADFTDTTDRLGPVDAIIGQGPKPKGQAPTKHCEFCGAIAPASAKSCENCHALFPPPKEPDRIKHGAQASAAAILSGQEPKIEEFPVDRVRYSRHDKPGGPPTLRVEYCAGLLVAGREWVCLSHEGYARRRAEMWWATRSKIDAIPSSVDAAMEWLTYDESILRRPVSIRVAKMDKYPQVVSYEWSAT